MYYINCTKDDSCVLRQFKKKMRHQYQQGYCVCHTEMCHSINNE